MNLFCLFNSCWWEKSVRCIAMGAVFFSGCLAFGATEDISETIHMEIYESLSARQGVTIRQLGNLVKGAKQTFQFEMTVPESLDLRIGFKHAPFNGTKLNVEFNGHRLLPYFAFGGDTRYDRVKNDPGMRPPLATIEGRWLIPANWVLTDSKNDLVIWTTGIQVDNILSRIGPVPKLEIESVTLGAVDGGNFPIYANSIYYDFSIWAQGQPWGLGVGGPRRHRFDLALSGIINGDGISSVIPPLSKPQSALWAVKRACEDDALGWGIAHREFYTIWEFAGNPRLWAKYINVDGDLETQSTFHEQTISAKAISNAPTARGADVVLYDVEKYANTLDPAIRMLAPYADYYNFKCEQRGPAGQGFGSDGQRWSEFNMTGDDWARNHYQAAKAARDLVQRYDSEDGRVQEMHFWHYRGVRHLLYDSALKHDQPAGKMIDIFMTHFNRLETYDYDVHGNKILADTYDLQYPNGINGDLDYPEIAIDFNRFRLGHTEADMHLGDLKVNRWGNGDPFDYRAGFRGDELMHNSENGVWNTGYSAPAPYQFLQGFFSYSLLPTGSSEPRDLHVTKRASLTDTNDHHVNLFGHWIESAGFTKRLRTVDPLYGDLFGWTGQEYCTYGDSISMVGIKEPHHRIPPFDAYGLVRRICYAFVTSGPICPAYLNNPHSDDLFVKCLIQTFDSEPYIGIYAANFDSREKTLDVTLPISFPKGTMARIYDDRAWDWQASAQVISVPSGRHFRHQAKVPALGAYLVLISAGPEVIAHTMKLPAPPLILLPIRDAAISETHPTFQWQKSHEGTASYAVEVAREALFRPQDRVELSDTVKESSYTMRTIPDPQWRYFWRVRAIDENGRWGMWTRPRAFVYQWPEYSAEFPPQPASLGSRAHLPHTEIPGWDGPLRDALFASPDNLAHQGEIFATEGHAIWHDRSESGSGSRAVDLLAYSVWNNGGKIPAQWCVIWPKRVRFSRVKILWADAYLPSEFAIQISNDAQVWTEIYQSDDGNEQLTELNLERSVEANYFRIYITGSDRESLDVAIREVLIQ